MKRFGLRPGRQKEATDSYRSSKFLPNTHGVSAMSEKMEDSFWLSTTEGANNVVGQPLAWSLSAVQSLFWMASHPNNLHLGGAQTFQMSVPKLAVVDPKNWAL